MARSFLLLSSTMESNSHDIRDSRRQAQLIRNTEFLTREDNYVQCYRLSEDLISLLETDISHLIPSTKKRGRGLSTRIKILATLSFLANGSYQKNVGKQHNNFLSQASVSRSIREVVEAINNTTIVKKYLRFPQNTQERQRLKARFYEKFHFPGVIGCIDGTYVSMIRPKNYEERFYCRKGYHARNIQLITNADLNILHVDASYGGASHDSFIFNHCSIKAHMENLVQAGEHTYLLGDSGYAQRPYMMTPVHDAEENTSEAHYNRIHASARNSVERTIGLLKGRFRCLLVHRVLHYNPDMVAKIVIACCVLHNICNRAGIPAPAMNQEELITERTFSMDMQQQPTNRDPDELALGRNARQDLIYRLWYNRMEE